MRDIQVENGWFRFSVDMADDLCRFRIAPDMRSVIDVVIRKTWGWKKKEDLIALSTFAEMTGLDHPNVCRAIRRLKAANIIRRDSQGLTSLVKDSDQWKLSPRTPPVSKMTLSKMTTTSVKSDNKPVSKMTHSIDSKETYQKKGVSSPSAGDNPTIDRALGMKADDPSWPEVIEELRAQGFTVKLGGDSAGVFDGRWKVRGAAGWAYWNDSFTPNLTITRKRANPKST